MPTTPGHLITTQYGEAYPDSYVIPRPKGARGYGAEAYGDPYGAGGPLSLVFAVAVKGQTVRAVFNEEPAHFSPAGPTDGLNPSNYYIDIVIGQGTVPNVIGVNPEPLRNPAAGVHGADEWGFDVYLDHPVALGVRYRINGRRIQSRAGMGLGFTYGAIFTGIVAPATSRPRARRAGYDDLASAGLGGAFRFDDSGDVGVVTGIDGLRMRVVRRCTTVLDSFSFLRGYGTPLRLKWPISVANLAVIQADLRKQILREPEVEACAVATSLVPLPGILTVNIQVRAKQGSLTLGMDVQSDGTISVR